MLRCIRFLAAFGFRALVAVLGIEVVVHIAVKFVSAVEPWTGTHEDGRGKPFRAIVTVRSAIVRRRIIEAVRAVWGRCGFAGLERLPAGAFAVKEMLAAITSATKMMSRFKVVPPPCEQFTFRPIFRSWRSPDLRNGRFRQRRFVDLVDRYLTGRKISVTKVYQKSLRSSSVTPTPDNTGGLNR